MGKRILFVDDEPDVLRVATFRLKKAGYEVVNAVDGQEALSWVKKERFDIIFLDLRLPGTDGLTICSIIKSDDAVKNIPVILFTASLNDLEQRVKDCGAQGYLLKPFEPQQLLDIVNKFIE